MQAGQSVAGYGLTGAGGVPSDVALHEGDIRDADRLATVLRAERPEIVYHLAALSHVARSWDQRTKTLDVNVLGTAALLEAIARSCPGIRVLLVSSGQVYGRVEEDAMPLREERPAHPSSPYTASKLSAEIVALQAAAAGEVEVVVVRPFNFAGPGQEPTFVCADFARQIARAERGLGPAQLEVGNLESRRDFCDVRDMVTGFRSAAEHGTNGGIFNLCSGVGTPIADVLGQLCAMASVAIDVTVDPERLRRVDVPQYVGDNTRAREQLRWSPRIAFRQTLEDTLQDWRQRVREEG